MKVSIIIVNYHTADLIVDCVRSIHRHTRDVEYEVIVVDNASGDGLELTMSQAFGDRVRCIMLDRNVGFGQANNAGFEAATGDYLFCLNPDTLLLNNAVKALAQYLEQHPRAAACGGNLYDADMQPAYSFYRALPGIRYELYSLSANKLPKLLYCGNWCHNHTGRAIAVPCVTGADLMMRRDVVQLTGGFSREFFMYYEETDLCARIKALGFDIVSVPWARIMHLEGASFHEGDTINQRRYEMIAEGRATYMRRHASPCKRWLCDRIYAFNLWLWFTVFRLSGNPLYRLYAVRRKVFKQRKCHPSC